LLRGAHWASRCTHCPNPPLSYLTRKSAARAPWISCIVDEYITHEWAFIPHFYSSYYVFQYATSFTASSALSEEVLAGDPGATQRYLYFISSGKSKYPIELLKDAGVDMTTDEPLELTVKKMNCVMDEMEKLLDKKASPSSGS